MGVCQWIDSSLAGLEIGREDDLTVPAFLAGCLREVTMSKEFQQSPPAVRHRVSHLSFLAHLVCRFPDMCHLIYPNYCQLLETLSSPVWPSRELEVEQAKLLSNMLQKDKQGREAVKLEVKMGYTTEYENEIKDGEDDLDVIDREDWLGEEIEDPNVKNELRVKMEADNVNVESNHEKIKLKCSLCIQTFHSRKWLNKHMRNKHEDSVTLKTESGNKVFCPDCNENIQLGPGESLTKHTNSQHKSKVACPCCPSTFMSEKCLLSHMQKQHEVQGETISCLLCSTCGATSSSFKEYYEHLRSHEDNSCKICSKNFSTRKALISHSKYAHPSGNDVPRESSMCPYCGKAYKYLPFHIYKVHSGREIQCDLCEYKTTLNCYMVNHKKLVHEGFTTTCEDCGKVVKQIKHHRTRGCPARKKAERLSCPHCDKTFALRDGLTRHIKHIHMNVKDKCCPHCDYRTAVGFNLKIHIARVHEGKQLKDECPYCNKSVVSLDWHLEKYHKKALDDKVDLTKLVPKEVRKDDDVVVDKTHTVPGKELVKIGS